MQKRIDQLDGIRGVALLSVFLHHTYHVPLLWGGVDLFFILSGFLITGILLKQKEGSLKHYFGHFYGRRARRILPPYLLLLLLTVLLHGVGWLRYWYFYPFAMNFLIPLHVPHPGALDILWSLAVEEQFYFVWPWAVYYLSERALARLAATLLVLAPLLRLLCTPLFAEHWSIYLLTPFRMDLLAAGALLAIGWHRRREAVLRLARFGPALAAAGVLALALLSRQPLFHTTANTWQSNLFLYELTLVVSLGLVLWALGGRRIAPLRFAPLRYVGRISYSMYLIHLTLILGFDHLIPRVLPRTLLCLVLTLGYAALSWQLLERPLLAAGRTPLPEPVPAEQGA